MVTIRTLDGRTFRSPVEHVADSVGNPMADVALHKQFADIAKAALSDESSDVLSEQVWLFNSVKDIEEITRLASRASC